MKSVIADTGVWLAICDARDPYHARTADMWAWLDHSQIILPWPVLYETLRTRLVRNTRALGVFERAINRQRVEWLDDEPWRQAAFHLSLDSSLRRHRPLSFVDCLIRLIIDDINTKVDGLLTFNPGDFADICRKRRIELV